MSLDALRDAAVQSKTQEVESASRAQSASLLALHAVTNLLSKNASIASLIGCKYDAESSRSYDGTQLRFLQTNALQFGRRFDEASLPYPVIPVQHARVDSQDSSLGPKGIESVALANGKTQSHGDMSVALNDIAPPEPEESARFDASTQKLIDRQSPKRPARTVHLPPERVQEERLHDMTADKVHSHVHNDVASSPSSTIAHSMATPGPPQDSPDTSPNSEVASADVPPEYRPSPDEQRAKEQHDRLLAAQKSIAHQAALGDVNTPDDQLRWEEREAAAREAAERKATVNTNGPEPMIVDAQQDETAAQALLGQRQEEASRPPSSRSGLIAKSDQDTIAVLPRGQPQLTQESKSAPHASPTLRRSLTESSMPADKQRETHSSGDSPKRALWSPPKRSNKTDVEEICTSLVPLQGAAQDPDRDYLEPLFKIQAHDSPNIRTSALPDLIRAASKTISTEDQFTSMHERLEYRTLRRIYHLQNANKWSLRQMERCKEPEQPVSHQDHMMAELKWMCKDFRAERKRKKSICAWLAARCAEWVAADHDARLSLQVKVAIPAVDDLDVPSLDASADSPEDVQPDTPRAHDTFLSRLVVDHSLLDAVQDLQQAGALSRVLKQIPVWRPEEDVSDVPGLANVSKFVQGKVLSKLPQPIKKRSRFDYEDEVSQDPNNKRQRQESDLLPEDPDVAIFNPVNKQLRERVHAQNSFRPPSEFQMPSIPFYEFRNGSQWIAEDDQKLRRLAREHTFNWSLISDVMSLPSRFKSGMERRSPWECFERWVELEQMPAEMRKTAYFKTWYSRLEQGHQNVEKRYQTQLAQFQAQAQQSGITPQHQPMRRRTVPSRVEKRKNTRYLWTVDAMRKNAKKRELAAYKQADATRAAAQRKASQQTTETQTPRQPMLTPQQFSQKRHERDLQIIEAQKQHRQKLIEAQQRQAQLMRAAAQGMPVPQQRQAGGPSINGAQQAVAQPGTVTAQMAQAQRHQLALAARNGQLAINGAPGQSVPQAQMQAAGSAAQQNMQRMAAQMQAQARNGQLSAQQLQFAAMQQNGNAASPGTGAMTTQQQLANNQALLAAYQQQQHHHQQQQQQQGTQQQSMTAATNTAAQHSASPPNMPPPPAPQQLSSGMVPAFLAIKQQLRNAHPTIPEDQLTRAATEALKKQSASIQVRHNAMAAAAGMTNAGVGAPAGNLQVYAQNQAFQNGGTNVNFATQDGNAQTANMTGTNNSTQHSYAQMMRQQAMNAMRMQQSPTTAQAVPNGSPIINQASPSLTPVSPAMQYNNMNVQAQGQRPPSRSATPQMQRLNSSNSVPGVIVPGMQSPGAVSVQASPRSVQASIAR